MCNINKFIETCSPSMTARVKISQNFDILAMVYLVNLSRTLSNLTCTFTGQNESTAFDW